MPGRLQQVRPQYMSLVKCLLDGLIRAPGYPMSDRPFGAPKLLCPDTSHPLEEPRRFRKPTSRDLMIHKSPENDVLAGHSAKLHGPTDNPMSAGRSPLSALYGPGLSFLLFAAQ